MGKYKAYIKQEGEGCDYTIGCARNVITLQANSMSEAIEQFVELLKESYSYDESRLRSAEIYEISDIYKFDLKKLYSEIDADEEDIKFMQKELEELKEYERLKNKYENK